jgi:hypothetical protein
MSHLILPNGIRPKAVSDISAQEMAWLASAEDVLRKLKMAIICTRCQLPVEGNNDPTDATISVTCGCRRLIYRVRADVAQ